MAEQSRNAQDEAKDTHSDKAIETLTLFGSSAFSLAFIVLAKSSTRSGRRARHRDAAA
jgi:hypothetical protein